jgi:hypothetical protein
MPVVLGPKPLPDTPERDVEIFIRAEHLDLADRLLDQEFTFTEVMPGVWTTTVQAGLLSKLVYRPNGRKIKVGEDIVPADNGFVLARLGWFGESNDTEAYIIATVRNHPYYPQGLYCSTNDDFRRLRYGRNPSYTFLGLNPRDEDRAWHRVGMRNVRLFPEVALFCLKGLDLANQQAPKALRPPFLLYKSQINWADWYPKPE